MSSNDYRISTAAKRNGLFSWTGVATVHQNGQKVAQVEVEARTQVSAHGRAAEAGALAARRHQLTLVTQLMGELELVNAQVEDILREHGLPIA